MDSNVYECNTFLVTGILFTYILKIIFEMYKISVSSVLMIFNRFGHFLRYILQFVDNNQKNASALKFLLHLH